MPTKNHTDEKATVPNPTVTSTELDACAAQIEATKTLCAGEQASNAEKGIATLCDVMLAVIRRLNENSTRTYSKAGHGAG